MLPIWLHIGHLSKKLYQVSRLKRHLQCAQLIADATHSPHIGVEVVPLVVKYFRRHVGRSSHARRSEGHAFQHRGDAEISDPQVPASATEKDVRALEVPVQHVLRVHVREAPEQLPEPGEDDKLGQSPLGCRGLLHHLPKVAILSEGHDDEEVGCLDEAVAIRDQVGVCCNTLEEADLLLRVRSAVHVQALQVHDLGRTELPVWVLARRDAEDRTCGRAHQLPLDNKAMGGQLVA
mmetsp:Transcript_32567/g.107404  ORF Transcript_32567/g.107404 Transcript_32567/m.107404 type:complete len:235 (+) Transcript_32567:448-1152(+)